MNRIVKGEGEWGWREWIDLEHSTCYNVTNHWNALTDGVNWKYIFNAYFGNETLFDLRNDPWEMNDLAMERGNEEVDRVMAVWRRRMVQMFEEQGRGDKWVLNGTLQQRLEIQTYGEHFPQNGAPCQ